MKAKLIPKTAARPSGKNVTIRVSIIENDAPVLEILKNWLTCVAGFEFVSGFGCAEDSLSQLLRQKPDVVLIDIKLPGMSGVECVRQLKPQLPQTRFVMHTAHEDASHVFDALKSGASGYLLKQLAPDELLAALKYAHAGGSPLTSSVARSIAQGFSNFSSVPAPAETDDNLSLSSREQEVLEMLARGFLYKEIAEALRISVRTVDTYIRRIYEKFHVRSRAQAVAKYIHLPPANARLAHLR